MSSPSETPILGYEKKDASILVIAITTALVAGGVFGSIVTSAIIYRDRYTQLQPAHGRQSSFTHGPDARTSISAEVQSLQHESAEHLDGYRWIDRKSGTVQIPIERAMDLVAREADTQAPAPKTKP